MCRLMRRAAVQERRQFHDLCVFPPRGRFAPVEQMCEFAMEVRVKSNTYPSTHHDNPLRNPSDHPACPTLPPSTHFSPLSTPAICSCQAKCARSSTPGLPMILESIVRSSTSCSSSCAWFLLPSSSRAARAVRVLLPGAGRGARWPNLLVSLGCRWLGGSKLVCALISGYVWAAEEEFVWVNFIKIGLRTGRSTGSAVHMCTRYINT